jgi:hypothetical protein
MEVELKLDPAKLAEVRERLAHLPGKARFSLVNSIRYALRRGRTAALRIAAERYSLGTQYSKAYRWALQSMGPVRISGTTGFIHVSGSRIPLMLFPHRQTVEGAEVQEMVDKTQTFAHTFGKNVWRREGKGAPRYPIMRMVGLATAQMVGEKSEVEPKLTKSIEQDLYKELDRLMRVALAGGLPS